MSLFNRGRNKAKENLESTIRDFRNTDFNLMVVDISLNCTILFNSKSDKVEVWLSDKAPYNFDNSILKNPVKVRGYDRNLKRVLELSGKLSKPSDSNRIYILKIDDFKLGESARASYRVNMHEAGSIKSVMRSESTYNCYLKDLSVGGVKFQCTGYFKVADILEIGIPFIENTRIKPIRCKVCRVESCGISSFYYSCKFINVDPKTERELSAFINDRQIKDIKGYN